MLLYGDSEREVTTATWLQRINDTLAQLAHAPTNLARHATLVGALIETGMLVQGVADTHFEIHGEDAETPALAALTVHLMALAAAVQNSWDSGCSGLCIRPFDTAPDPAHLPLRIRVREPEGFAHYALYPEAYLTAARHAALGPQTTVIGIRSIGTTLAAMVATGLGARQPKTVRPFGHPFDRQIALRSQPEFACANGAYAIVDEGPGLSGSSIAAAIALLIERDIPPARIHVFPGHAGPPGREANARHRTLWASVKRHACNGDDPVLAPDRLPRWAEEQLGAPIAPLQDISGGAWRTPRTTAPANPHHERRKFLWRTRDATWLLKFAGLGALGEAKRRCAERLHEGGFTPRVAALCHGFLIERWHEDAAPLVLPLRATDLAYLAHYLAFRQRHLPVGAAEGAAPSSLLAMARYNATEALGAASAAPLAQWELHIPAFTQGVRRVWTDNRMQSWEWLRTTHGRLIKTDAVDHARAHDLIGCQDIAWDIAGASVELSLTTPQEAWLGQCLGRDATTIRFHKHCYLAFQLGLFTEAAATADSSHRPRLAAIARGHTETLQAALRIG